MVARDIITESSDDSISHPFCRVDKRGSNFKMFTSYEHAKFPEVIAINSSSNVGYYTHTQKKKKKIKLITVRNVNKQERNILFLNKLW